ncbi:hypothetical protein AAY473_006888, partial [Plecturocebus cupreus]
MLRFLYRALEIVSLCCPGLSASGMILAHCTLHLSGPSHPHASAFRIDGTTGMHQHLQILFVCLFEDAGSCHVAQDGLELLASLSLPKWSFTLSPRLEYNSMILAHCTLHLLGSKTGFYHVGHGDLDLVTLGDPPALASQSTEITGVSHHAQPKFLMSQCSGTIMAHCHLDGLGSSKPPPAALQ